MVKTAARAIAPGLISIFNQYIDESLFPDDFKFADITPALMANDPLDKNIYRPISILSDLSKVLEGIMNDQLSDYFNHILFTLISAFRKHYSCQSILLKMIEDWKSALDKQNIIGAVMIDLSKAFDNTTFTSGRENGKLWYIK